MMDWARGEEVNYTYDSLNRLSRAETTGPRWGNAYTYDGFGNLTQKTVTKGTAPVRARRTAESTRELSCGTQHISYTT